MEFTQTEIQEMRMEIITMFDRRPKKETKIQIHRGLYMFRDNMVVKRGFAPYRKDEFENQLHVWTLVDPRIVRVPRPIDHFEYTYPGSQYPTGFIVMEYVANGKQQLNLSGAQIDQVATIIDYLMTFKGTVPGGLMMGAWDRGVMFGDFPSFAPKPGSIEVLNQWIHRRRSLGSAPKSEPADFGEFDLVLCRMDIRPEDILWSTDGGAPWLVDWQRAVYLPRLFQHFIHKRSSRGHLDFDNGILLKLEPLTERETELLGIFRVAWGNSIRRDIWD